MREGWRLCSPDQGFCFMGTRKMNHVIPAAPGFSCLEVIEEGDAIVGYWTNPIVAWVIEINGKPEDAITWPVCVDPISQGGPIQAPDGSVHAGDFFYKNADQWLSEKKAAQP